MQKEIYVSVCRLLAFCIFFQSTKLCEKITGQDIVVSEGRKQKYILNSKIKYAKLDVPSNDTEE